MPIANNIKYYIKSICLILILALPLPSYSANDSDAIQSLKRTGRAFADVAKQVSPSVVNIQVEQEVRGYPGFRRMPFDDNRNSPFSDDFFRFFFGEPFHREHPSNKQVVVGQGSGFIINSQGYIITNYHVIKDASKIRVKLLNGEEKIAKAIGSDPQSDVAVIKIEGSDYPALSLGDSDSMDVGEWVVAVGNPFGLSHTLTAGIISAKGRSRVGITDYENFIQTDAAINPGNSGGPLVNLDGQAIGINTAIFSKSGGSMGVGFAIPINMAKHITDQLIEEGSVTRGYLGVAIQDLTQDLANTFGLNSNTKGILVSDVMNDSPASKAGLKQGDIILKLNGNIIDTGASFRNKIALSQPGSKHNLTIYRNGKEKNLKIKVGKQDDSQGSSKLATATLKKLGISVQNITSSISREFSLDNKDGVIISDVEHGTAASLVGLRQGMVILEVNREKIKSISDIQSAIEKSKNKSVLLLVKTSNGAWYVTLPLQ